MKQKLTKLLFSLAGILLITGGLQAQWVLEITEPASVAGVYEYGYANFGSNGFEAAELAIGMDSSADPTFGCNPLVTDLTGKVGLLDRGGCFFSQKSFRAQEAGAVAVIICNNDAGFINMAPGDFADDVNVPVFMLDPSDCLSIRAAMESGPVVATSYFVGWREDGILWGDEEGQGDFANGIGDWTTVGISDPDHIWEYKPNSNSAGGCGSFRLNSFSVSNGAMVFDADFYMTGGPEDAGGIGCQGPEQQIQGELWSPVIDASEFDQLAIEFYQLNLGISLDPDPGSLRERTYMQFSTDGGQTWGDRVPIQTTSFQSTLGSSITNPERVVIIVPEASNEPEFRFKFVYDGSFYTWIIDDVRLVEPPENDLAILDAFYPLLSFATPDDHIGAESFGFEMLVANEGFNAQENVRGSVRVVNSTTGEIQFEESVESQSLDRGQLDTITFSTFTPNLPVGNYSIEYRVENVGVPDQFPEKNTVVHNFIVTENLYAKDDPVRNSFSGGITNSDDSWVWGNMYYISPESGDNGRPLFLGAEMAFVPTAGEYSDEFAIVYLLEYVPTGPFVNFQQMNAAADVAPPEHPDWNEIALSIVDVDQLMAAGNGQVFRLWSGDFLNPSDFNPFEEPIELNPGKLYALVVLHEGDGLRMPITTINYSAGVGLLWVDNTAGNKQYFSGYTNNGGPIVRMITDVWPVSVDDQFNIDQFINIYPVPTSDDLYIEMSLEQPTDINYQIFDLQGRLLESSNIRDVSREVIRNDVRAYQSGNYYIRIQTPQGNSTRPFIIMQE